MVTPKRDAHRPSRKTELLEAALEEFAVGDITEISMAKIAMRAQMTTAAVYYHFKSKDALLEALLAQANDSLAKIVVKAEPGTDMAVWTHETVERFGQWVRQHPLEARFVFISASAPSPAIRAIRMKTHNRVVGSLADQLSAIDPKYFDHVTAWFTGGALLVMFAEVVRSQLKDGVAIPRSFNTYLRGAQLVAENIVRQTPLPTTV